MANIPLNKAGADFEGLVSLMQAQALAMKAGLSHAGVTHASPEAANSVPTIGNDGKGQSL